MKVEVKEAMESMKLLQELTQPTIKYLEKLTKPEFEVQLREGKAPDIGPLVKSPMGCLAGDNRPEDCQRLAAASVLLARFLTGR